MLISQCAHGKLELNYPGICSKTAFYLNTSTISMSSILFPADFKAALEAGAGPMPITFGSQPIIE